MANRLYTHQPWLNDEIPKEELRRSVLAMGSLCHDYAKQCGNKTMKEQIRGLYRMYGDKDRNVSDKERPSRQATATEAASKSRVQEMMIMALGVGELQQLLGEGLIIMLYILQCTGFIEYSMKILHVDFMFRVALGQSFSLMV